jgi:hypothetical protein
MRHEHPFERHADDAAALLHAGGGEEIANFPSRQLGRGGQGIQREGGGKSLLESKRAVDAAERDAVEAVASSVRPSRPVNFLRRPKLIFKSGFIGFPW